MKKLLLASILVLLPDVARAGFGTTGYFGSNEGWWNNNFRRWGRFPGVFPSLDYRTDPVILQFHAMEFLDALSQEQIFLGGNFYYALEARPLTGEWDAVFQPGASLDIAGDPFRLGIGATARLGAEVVGDAGFGLYVVPTLGIAFDDGDAALLLGGAIQISTWFATGRRR